jgi:hypothetical protein
MTFFISGLLHEYTFSIHNRGAYELGHITLFFLAMGMLMLLGEEWVWKWIPLPVLAIICKLLSPFISMFMAFVSAGSFERYFVQSWLDAGVVENVAEMLPHLRCS